MMPLRNRIRGHRRVRAGDLVPHELNYRQHPPEQKAALEALYRTIGFARSLLAYELPDGRLKLIDGHLRRDLRPDEEVDVEIVDLDDAEARTLLLSIDPLAALAGCDEAAHTRLRELTPTDEAALAQLWEAAHAPPPELPTDDDVGPLAEKFMLLIECRDEAQQRSLLERFAAEGLACRALVS